MFLLQELGENSKLFLDKTNHYDIFFSRSDLGNVTAIDTNNSIQKMVFIICEDR